MDHLSERERLGGRFPMGRCQGVAPVVFRSVVATEDANFCDRRTTRARSETPSPMVQISASTHPAGRENVPPPQRGRSWVQSA